ncbi:alginate lyase family protein [Marinobacter adhaerens]|uniref:Alginate lyase family protein n=1 Tax=Marinobacter adhaerens TaxID=1033846 RepID=A0A851I0W7_9GAMM|nr:alginate lyase family protein [Marinobacter adhaerens]NWN91778.1 alginate lyase family protein [Marinobacter adhaerens]
MRRLILLLNTLRYLKAIQIMYQVYYRVHKPRVRELSKPTLRNQLMGWPGSSFQSPATLDGETFTFLGEAARFDGSWNNPAFPKLWLYNLHYQDDLNAIGAECRFQLCASMVEAWIEGNPPLQGNGWEPYCLSLRIVNWVKFFSRLEQGELRSHWVRSLAQQADALEQQLEFHILANHLFANAKALVFVGTYLGGVEGERWLRKGLALLDREVPEQFLNDGAHYERSPMYQGILLWDLLDLIALGKATGLLELKQRLGDWQNRAQRGLEWLRAMTHPDRNISFFNDATWGIAPAVEDLERYMATLGLSISKVDKPTVIKGRLLQPSGYGIVEWPESHRLLVDLAPVGPDYQPGHAHADTFSCELSLFGQRVLVNSGISQYGEGPERQRQRSTAAHNTVEVDGEDSSEVWAGFRVARRAKPFGVKLSSSEGTVSLSGSHDGYRRLAGRVTHSRHWKASDELLEITDNVNGSFEEALAHWHFHPDVSVQPADGSTYYLHLQGGQTVRFEVGGGTTEVVKNDWHPGFGVSKQSRKLKVALHGRKLVTRISWSSD